MKLEDYALDRAIESGDIGQILDIFAGHYPEVLRLKNKKWRMIKDWRTLRVPVKLSRMVRVVTLEQTYYWSDGDFYSDWRSGDCHLIRISPDFCIDSGIR